jgi:hypothetical protein
MKKVLSLMVILVSLFAGRAGTAQAAGLITYAGGRFILGKGIVFVFKASGFKRRNIKNASIFVGSNFHNLSCSVNKDDGKIVCVARGGLSDEYGGEPGIIHLAGQIFYVTIPYRIERPESDEESGCEEPEVRGAKVQFEDVDGSFFTEFIPGDSLDEVEGAAGEEVIANELAGHQVVGALSCGSAPEEEV